MKRKLTVVLVSVLLIISLLLTSCGSISSTGKYLNKKYDLTPDIFTEAADLDDLEGYVLDTTAVDEEFALFYKVEDVDVTYKVFSFSEGDVVATFAGDADTFYTISLMNDSPAFFVKKAKIDNDAIAELTDESEIAEVGALLTEFLAGELDIEELIDSALDEFAKFSFTLYDAAGEEIASSSKYADARIFADKIIFNSVVYDIDYVNSTLTKELELPEYMDIGDCTDYSEDYYYIIDPNSSITVYDREFNLTTIWYAPDYADESILEDEVNFHILNNGDILVQYIVFEDEDAKRFDFSYVEDGITYKADLVSQLISAKNGKVRDLDLDYAVGFVYTNYELYDADKTEEENVFNDKFDNIAAIMPIEDQKLLSAIDDIDYVLMNNDGKAKSSIKMVDGQLASFAEKIDDDKYMVYLLDGGTAVIKANGKVLATMNNPLDRCGNYFVGSKAIYNLDLEKVYDLDENDATVISFMQSAVIIKEETDKGYDIVKLLDGEEETIYSHNDDESETSFIIEDYAYYYIIEDEDGEYSYFNEKGEKIVSSEDYLTFVAYSDTHKSALLFSGADADTNFCLFK